MTNRRTRSYAMRTLLLVAMLVGAAPASDVAAKDGEGWAEGVPYLTDYDDAIKAARESGRMLLIYNGWKREGI